jgi:predicted nuclease with TOPRIM domain
MCRRRDHRELLAVNAELRAELRQVRRELERLRVENEVLQEAAEPVLVENPAIGVTCGFRQLVGVRW